MAAGWLMRLDRPEANLAAGYPHRKLERPNLAMARKVVEYASAAWLAEPTNALYPQLVASAYLAQHRDAEALAMLERAARLTDWSDHREQAVQIIARALRLDGQTRTWSQELAVRAVAFRIFPDPLAATAKTAAGLGYEARQAGDDALAMRWYGAVYGMAPPMLRHTKWFSVAHMASELPLYPARTFAASVAVPRLRGMQRLESEVRTTLLLERMHDYLVQHGRPDLADQAVIETVRADIASNESRIWFSSPLWDAEHDYGALWSGQLWVTFVLLVCAALAILGAIAAGVLSLRKPRAAPQANQDATGLGASIARILLVAVPLAVLAIGLPYTVLYLSEVAPRLHEILNPRLMMIFIVIIILALLFVVGAAIEAWKWLRRWQRDGGFAGRWLRAMGAMLPRIVALLLLLYLLVFIPVSWYGAQLERRATETIERGDLPAYVTYGLFSERR
jgi:hypothetical protein